MAHPTQRTSTGLQAKDDGRQLSVGDIFDHFQLMAMALATSAIDGSSATNLEVYTVRLDHYINGPRLREFHLAATTSNS